MTSLCVTLLLHMGHKFSINFGHIQPHPVRHCSFIWDTIPPFSFGPIWPQPPCPMHYTSPCSWPLNVSLTHFFLSIAHCPLSIPLSIVYFLAIFLSIAHCPLSIPLSIVYFLAIFLSIAHYPLSIPLSIVYFLVKKMLHTATEYMPILNLTIAHFLHSWPHPPCPMQYIKSAPYTRRPFFLTCLLHMGHDFFFIWLGSLKWDMTLSYASWFRWHG